MTKQKKPRTDSVTITDSNIGLLNTGDVKELSSAVGQEAQPTHEHRNPHGRIAYLDSQSKAQPAAAVDLTIDEIGPDGAEALDKALLVEALDPGAPLDLSQLGNVLERMTAVLGEPAEPTPAIHDPTPEPPRLEPLPELSMSYSLTPGQPTHSMIRHMAMMASHAGISELSLTVNGECIRRLRSELGPEGAELAAHRWGGSEVRILTAIGWVRVIDRRNLSHG